MGGKQNGGLMLCNMKGIGCSLLRDKFHICLIEFTLVYRMVATARH